MDSEINSIKELLTEIMVDSDTPKNVRAKCQLVNTILDEECENSIKVNKALAELEDTVNDSNVQQFTRTQLWNVTSLLEKI